MIYTAHSEIPWVKTIFIACIVKLPVTVKTESLINFCWESSSRLKSIVNVKFAQHMQSMFMSSCKVIPKFSHQKIDSWDVLREMGFALVVSIVRLCYVKLEDDNNAINSSLTKLKTWLFSKRSVCLLGRFRSTGIDRDNIDMTSYVSHM